jgi:hypothetical protein
MNEDTRPGHEGRWRLEPIPSVSWWESYTGLVRNGFELHLGHVSLGCITANADDPETVEDYNAINQLLRSENGHNTLMVDP